MAVTPSSMVQLRQPCPDFALPDTEGQAVGRTDFEDTPLVVAFICNHCPYIKHIADRFAEVAQTLQDRGIGVVAINSNDAERYPDDSPEAMRAEKQERGYPFPYLFDETQEVARAFDAQCTPDLFLYDRDHRLYYRGQFDEARPGNGKPVTGGDLLAAADALLAEREPPEAQRPSQGCNIKWREP